jgi:5-methylcytosine-specific restriction endonuclease McrA
VTRTYPCIVCGVPTRGSNRCAEHRLKDARPGTARRGSRSVSTRLRRRVLFRDSWTCRSCGLVDRSGRLLEADHVVRLADGGEHVESNMQTLCKACHREKSRREVVAGRG